MMDFKRYLVFLLIWPALFSAGQMPSDPLSRLISFKADSISKAVLLDSIGKNCNLFFSYNPSLINAEEKVSVDFAGVPLSQIFYQLIDPEKISYASIGNQVVFFPAGSKEEASMTVVELIRIKGIILDEKNNEPLPFCNIALAGYPIGTISNQNGRFLLKIDPKFKTDTIRISCIGYQPQWIPVSDIQDQDLQIVLQRNTIHLKSIDVIHYSPTQVLDSFFSNIQNNYETDYVLLSTFYREIIRQNGQYTDISEAVMEVMKAPYDDEFRDDHVKFVKGRKSSETQPYSQVKLRLKGGPYYITQLDVIKNLGSFLDPEYRYLYNYAFVRTTSMNHRETIVIDFKPLSSLRDVLYQGKLYFDRRTWALCRIEFEMTHEGLKEARDLLIEKEPKKMKAIPFELSYIVDYQLVGNKWYFYTAKNFFDIKINDRQNRQKTRFNSTSEIQITRIEKGDIQQFSRRDIFKPNEFITEKIDTIDANFWQEYNIIEPEDELVEALRNFDSYNLVIKHFNPKESQNK